jgi:hypothetical protein
MGSRRACICGVWWEGCVRSLKLCFSQSETIHIMKAFDVLTPEELIK